MTKEGSGLRKVFPYGLSTVGDTIARFCRAARPGVIEGARRTTIRSTRICPRSSRRERDEASTPRLEGRPRRRAGGRIGRQRRRSAASSPGTAVDEIVEIEQLLDG